MSEQELNPTADTGETTTPQGDKPAGEGKTFTQDEVNRIVGKRLAEAQAKADALLAQKEAEIAQREYDHHTKTTLEAKKLPSRLLDALKGGDIQTFDQSVAIIEELMDKPFKAAVQAAVEERLRGSVPRASNFNAPKKDDGVRGAMGLK